MNRRGRKLILSVAVAAALALLAVAPWWCLAGRSLPAEWTAVQRLPHIRPDYSETVIPPNMAPLNFVVEEAGVEYRVRIHGDKGEEIVVAAGGPSVDIPLRPWRQLLNQNRGGGIVFDVYVKDADGRWSRFGSVKNTVAEEDIDSHVVYRLIGPLCNLYRDMGLYQRNLETFDESPVVTNDSFGGCMNCHSFANNRADLFALQVRPTKSRKNIRGGLFLVRGAQAVELQIESRAAPGRPSYIAWHPSGSLIAFSMTKTKQVFHGAGAELREGYDTESHLAILNVETGVVTSSPGIADPTMQEAAPCWSADGRTLYFCSAKTLWGKESLPRISDLKSAMYDLKRVNFDVEKNRLGPVETLLTAAETGMSINQPRTSPDGRHLVFCMTASGNFPPYQANSDLYLLDLRSGKHRRLECNSESSEAWHCWSSNSRWIVFSSRRDNPLLTRLYFSYIDSQGKASKPFVLPQRDPRAYDSYLKMYNLPELISGPITIPQRELLRAIHATAPTSQSPQKPIPAAAEEYRID
jgi:hypothetical protein